MTDRRAQSGQTEAAGHSETTARDMGRMRGLGLLWGGIGAIGLFLTGFLVIGLLLPGTWSVERTRVLQAEPEVVYPYLADLGEWEQWTHWPELQNLDVGEGGATAMRSWDDPNYGRGSLRLVDTEAGRRVAYEVRVDGGIRIDGTIELTEADGGTRMTWQETGDFGRNPLLGYTARSMDKLQGDEMDKALDRLGAIVGPASNP